MGVEINIAKSTIAMSIYNVIAAGGRALTDQEVVLCLRKTMWPQIEDEDIGDPIAEMVKRGWVTRNRGFIEVVDQKRRLIRARAREDFVYAEDGEPIGGWSGWTTACEGCPGMLLDDIVKQSRQQEATV